MSMFINKVLLEHSHAHSFSYCLWLLSHCIAVQPTKPKMFTVWPFPEFVDPSSTLPHPVIPSLKELRI